MQRHGMKMGSAETSQLFTGAPTGAPAPDGDGHDEHGSAESPFAGLACTEVWGGNLRIERMVELPGLCAWVSSAPFEGSGGGDVCYFSRCSKGQLTRVALADVSGHGEPVRHLAERLRGLMHEHVSAWDQTDLMGAINDAFPKDLDDSRYATAVLVGVYPQTGDAVFTNAGHPLPLRYTARHRGWSWVEEDRRPVHEVAGLPVGLIPGTRYHQTALTLDPGDLLILYTDAFVEARDANGEIVDAQWLIETARGLVAPSAEAVGRALVSGLSDRRGGPQEDDETLIVLERMAV